MSSGSFGSGFGDLAGSIAGFIDKPSGYGLCGWALASVFVWSGFAKIRRPTLAALAMMHFRVAQVPRRMYGRLLGVTEVLLAGLLGMATAMGGGVISVSVFALAVLAFCCFSLLIGVALAGESEFPCFCFGDGSDSISAWTLVRTLGLGLMAAALLVAAASRTRTFALEQTIMEAAAGGMLVAGFMVAGRLISLRRVRQSRSLRDGGMRA